MILQQRPGNLSQTWQPLHLRFSASLAGFAHFINFSWKCDSERIINIAPHLQKLWCTIMRARFFETQCMVYHISNYQQYKSLPETTPLERGYLRRRCRRRQSHRLKTQRANHRAPPTVPITVPMNHGCCTIPNCSRLIAFGPEITSQSNTFLWVKTVYIGSRSRVARCMLPNRPIVWRLCWPCTVYFSHK